MIRTLLIVALLTSAFAAPSTHKVARVPRLGGRIVGGEDVNIEQFNFQISLLRSNSHLCGGAIISPVYVISATHCTYRYSPSAFSVRAGSSIRNSGGVVVPVQTIYEHPQYDDSRADYDINILLLASPLTYSASIGPIRLPVQNQQIPSGTLSRVSGWGITSNGTLATQLQAVVVPILSMEECREAYSVNLVTDRMICAGYLGEGGRDACQNDSGGPLVVDDILVGVVSWGIGCGSPLFPGVYASVPYLRSFVTEITGL